MLDGLAYASGTGLRGAIMDSAPKIAPRSDAKALLERCESGRIGLTANELTWETGSEGSNPSLSAARLACVRPPAGRRAL